MTSMYLTRRQLLPSIFAWGYGVGNLPRSIRDQDQIPDVVWALDADSVLPSVQLLIPPALRDLDGCTHARVTWIADRKLYRVEWIIL